MFCNIKNIVKKAKIRSSRILPDIRYTVDNSAKK